MTAKICASPSRDPHGERLPVRQLRNRAAQWRADLRRLRQDHFRSARETLVLYRKRPGAPTLMAARKADRRVAFDAAV